MNKPKSIEPLDVLADRANFGDVEDSRISAMGKKLSDYIKGQKRMFYLWQNIDPNKVWADVEIVTFDSPIDYSGARMYVVKEQSLDGAVSNQSQIDLSKETPIHSGEEVAKVLKQYATQ